jgi:hypothetical protein
MPEATFVAEVMAGIHFVEVARRADCSKVSGVAVVRS